MDASLPFLYRVHERLSNLSIFTRIAIGNSVIILLGAIGGTAIVHTFTERGSEFLVIAFFAFSGAALSVLLNLWIVHAALKPLMDLRRYIAKISIKNHIHNHITLHNADPDTYALAASLSALIDQLEANNRRLQLFSNRAIRAQEEERKRIARSLHDETAQSLSSMIIALERLETSLSQSQHNMKEKLRAVREVCAHTLSELRNIISGLRPSLLDDVGLVAAIRWYAQSTLKEANIQLTFQAPDELPAIPSEVSTILFRIAQEAVNNIARHAQAKLVTITLGYTHEEIYLHVEDDGVGFHTSRDQNEAIQREHWGLLGIQERVELVSGTFHLASSPGKGTVLQVYVPIKQDYGNNDA